MLFVFFISYLISLMAMEKTERNRLLVGDAKDGDGQQSNDLFDKPSNVNMNEV